MVVHLNVCFERNRMSLSSSQAFYLLIDDKGIASMSMTLLELYEKKRDADGFLYMSYASQGKKYFFVSYQ